MKAVLLILSFILASSFATAEFQCTEENVKECIATSKHIAIEMFEAIKKSEKNINSYCGKLETEGECLKKAVKICEEENIKVLISALYDYLNIFCSDKSKMYMDIVPCFEAHKSAFEECFSHSKRKREINEYDEICKEMDSMQCLATKSEEKCRDGGAFKNAVETKVKELKKAVACKGAEEAGDKKDVSSGEEAHITKDVSKGDESPAKKDVSNGDEEHVKKDVSSEEEHVKKDSSSEAESHVVISGAESLANNFGIVVMAISSLIFIVKAF